MISQLNVIMLTSVSKILYQSFVIYTIALISGKTELVCLHTCKCKPFRGNANDISCALETKVIDPFKFSKTHEECKENVEIDYSYLSASNITTRCYSDSFNRQVLQNLKNLTHLAIIDSNLKAIPLNLSVSTENLKYYNLSGNKIADIYFPVYADFLKLKVLDLSRNNISEVFFEPQSLPQLTNLHLQRNKITDLSEIGNVNTLQLLDISFNPLSITRSPLYLLNNLSTLILHSIPSLSKQVADLCSRVSLCKVLPSNLKHLDLSHNSLLQVPSCNGLLVGLQKLQRLDLSNNAIATVNDDTFQSYCFLDLKYLSLKNNHLVQISKNFLKPLHFLQTLSLSNNYLQHISVNVMSQFYAAKSVSYVGEDGLSLDNNIWSCDCLQKDLLRWLVQNNISNPISCKKPQSLLNKSLKSLSEDQLLCTKPSISSSHNVSVEEYHDAELGCQSNGVPKRLISWYSPEGELISINSIMDPAQRELYSLSPHGENLTVKSVRLHKTGIFRCVAEDPVGSYNTTESIVALRVVLSHTSTIAYIVIACVAFMVAIVLNSVNMCMYIYEHIQAKRQYKKALQEQDKVEKQNPPIRSRSRSLNESIASLNADRHYGKYDFTCQQMFLDTVIKGAHSVKKTFYDARHSEFSANMWEYAANLRGRLHIEMPSQLPTISMPSISMPTISMPSIPTMQDINTNIERLGTSVMARSHNLATSVGSVFTLKRWVQQSHNSSDGESRDSDDHLDGGITSVKADVHKTHIENSETDSANSGSAEFNDLFTNRGDYDEIREPRCSKSLPDYRPSVSALVGAVRFSKKFPKRESKIVKSSPHDIPKEAKPVCQSIVVDSPSVITISGSVDKSCHSYETSL